MQQVTSTVKIGKLIMTLQIYMQRVAGILAILTFLHCRLCHCWHKEVWDRNICDFSSILRVCFIFIFYRNNSMHCNYPQLKKLSRIIAVPTKITINVVEKKRNMFQTTVHITIPAMPTKFYLVYL